MSPPRGMLTASTSVKPRKRMSNAGALKMDQRIEIHRGFARRERASQKVSLEGWAELLVEPQPAGAEPVSRRCG